MPALLLTLLLTQSPLTDSLWVRAVFHRILQENLQREEAHGVLYVQPGQHFVLEVQRPVHQVLTFRGDTLLLYYPEDSVAFKVKSNTRFLPLGPRAVAFDDARLQDLGFTFLRRQQRGDTLWIYWAHPQEKIRVTVRKVADRLHSLEFRDEHDQVVMRLVAREYQDLGHGWVLPRLVKTLQALPDGFSEETFRLDSLRLVRRVPPWVQRFQVPAGVRVILKGWEP